MSGGELSVSSIRHQRDMRTLQGTPFLPLPLSHIQNFYQKYFVFLNIFFLSPKVPPELHEIYIASENIAISGPLPLAVYHFPSLDINLRVKDSLSIFDKVPLLKTAQDIFSHIPKDAFASAVDEFGNTLLHHISLSNVSPAVVRTTLRMKLDVNAVNKDGLV
jgi:hypothetical protein